MKPCLCAVAVSLSSFTWISATHGAVLQVLSDSLPVSPAVTVPSTAGATPTLVGQPTRAGSGAFRHHVTAQSPSSEWVGVTAKPEGEYWYGWSLQVPPEQTPPAHLSLMRLMGGSPAESVRPPCGLSETSLRIDERGRLLLHLLHAGENKDEITCSEFEILDHVAATKGRWIDIVLHARWSSGSDGLVQLWTKLHDNNFFQRVDYQGPTWWKQSTTGPHILVGAQLAADSAATAAEVTVLTDEFRLADGHSGFDDVAPGADSRAREAGHGTLRYVLYPSTLTRPNVPVMVYTPPGYERETGRRYPVVYNLHGAGGGSPERQWERMHDTLVRAMESGGAKPLLYVFVNGIGDTSYLDHLQPTAPKVFSSITTELIPFIDAHYRTIAETRGRAVDGFSMGGGGAVMLATKRPDLFCAVVAYGGAFIPSDAAAQLPPGDPRRALVEQFSQFRLVERNTEAIRSQVRIRLVCGENDSLFPLNLKFKALLDRHEIPVSWIPVPGVAHETKALFDRTGIESLRFMEESFRR